MTDDPTTIQRAIVRSELELTAQVAQLQQQQALFTQIVAAQLEGKWTGEASAEALLYALNPNLTGTLTLDVPITESEAESLPKG
jgi:hypothetical protein